MNNSENVPLGNKLRVCELD